MILFQLTREIEEDTKENADLSKVNIKLDQGESCADKSHVWGGDLPGGDLVLVMLFI